MGISLDFMKIKSFCNTCKHETNQEVVATHKESFLYDNDEAPDTWAEWQVVKCAGCDTISFREVWESAEDFDYI